MPADLIQALVAAAPFVVVVALLVAAAAIVATMAHAATAETATQRVVRRGNRIGLSCLSRPGLGRLPKQSVRKRFRNRSTFWSWSQALLCANCGNWMATPFRNVP